MTTASEIVAVARKLLNSKTIYNLGAEVALDQSNFNIDNLIGTNGIQPLKVTDCSEFTQAVAWIAGVWPAFPDGAWQQAAYCRRRGTSISVTKALVTAGALLFKDHGPAGAGGAGNHVAISLGDGTCIEARSSRLTPNCGIWSAIGRGWNYAALFPDVFYGELPPPPAPPPQMFPPPVIVPMGQGFGENQPLDAGSSRLIAQSDGNLVIYESGKPIWSSNTYGSNPRVEMQRDGNFVLSLSGKAVGATMTVGTGFYAAFQADANLVICDVSGKPVWASKSSHWFQIP
jgi:cell wall-associated NlpC family hydrolase